MRHCQNCGRKTNYATNGNRKCWACRDVHLPDPRQIAARCAIERRTWAAERLELVEIQSVPVPDWLGKLLKGGEQ